MKWQQKKYPYTCPSCHANDEVVISRWSGLSDNRGWDCPHCGEHLVPEYARPILYKISHFALYIGLFLPLILGYRWFIIPILTLALYGLQALMWPPVVIRKLRPKDFIAEELGGKDDSQF